MVANFTLLIVLTLFQFPRHKQSSSIRMDKQGKSENKKNSHQALDHSLRGAIMTRESKRKSTVFVDDSKHVTATWWRYRDRSFVINKKTLKQSSRMDKNIIRGIKEWEFYFCASSTFGCHSPDLIDLIWHILWPFKMPKALYSRIY